MTILIEKTKKIILGLLVAGLAIGFSAFKMNEEISSINTEEVTWYFDPQEPTNNPNLASNYTSVNPGIGLCEDSDIICTIQDFPSTEPGKESQPELSHGDVTDNEEMYEATKRKL